MHCGFLKYPFEHIVSIKELTAHFISSSLAAIDWTKHGHLMQSLFWANWILSLEIFETEHRNSSLFRALGLEPSVWTTRKSRRN